MVTLAILFLLYNLLQPRIAESPKTMGVTFEPLPLGTPPSSKKMDPSGNIYFPEL
jgi:hypothetical protein